MRARDIDDFGRKPWPFETPYERLSNISAAKSFEGNCCFPELTDELSDNLKFLDVHIGNLVVK